MGVDGDALVLEATRIAGRLNGRAIVAGLADDPAYHELTNSSEPRRIDSQLDLYDCINCYLCISACPNDAIFAYAVEPASNATTLLTASAEGELQRSPGAGFTIREAHQLAVVEAACNECSNCEVYCPEDGAPFVLKERLFMSREAFAEARVDGFCREGGTLYARLQGLEMEFAPQPERNSATVSGEGFRLELSWEPYEVERGHVSGVPVGLDTAALWRLRTVWSSIFQAGRPNMLRPDPERMPA
jgi:putative selenate reductase